MRAQSSLTRGKPPLRQHSLGTCVILCATRVIVEVIYNIRVLSVRLLSQYFVTSTVGIYKNLLSVVLSPAFILVPIYILIIIGFFQETGMFL